jgi:predicted metalloendopeptidase
MLPFELPSLVRAAAAATTLMCSLAAHGNAIDMAALDRSVGPCQDFYRHVNAGWTARTAVPEDRGRIGSFDELRIANSQLLEKALADLAADPARATSPGLRLLRTAYLAAMDEAAIDRVGLAAVQPWLDRIAALKSASELPLLLAELARHRVAAPLTAWVGPDTADTRRHALYLGAEGLGLPDRDDYFKTGDATTERVAAAYRRYAAVLLKAAGAKDDAAEIDALLAFEKKLADATMTRVQRRDPQATNNRMDLAALAAGAAGFDWAAYLGAVLKEAGAVPVAERRFVVSQPRLMTAFAALAGSAPLADWQRYLRVRVLNEFAQHGPKALEQAHFDYHEAAVRGIRRPPPKVERVVWALGGRTGSEPLGLALGELYVSRAFSPTAQAKASAMVEDVKAAMRARIQTLEWMGSATRGKALAKLDAMALQIGGPAVWPRYEGLVLDAGQHARNLQRLAAWEQARRIADLDKPVDRNRWTTAPHIVNAFAGSPNRIVFPAGILQPPFFDERADDAVNYGAIGSVIGHEITHHFDDRGRQFDADGNLKDWWTAEDAAAYRARADRVAALYGGYEPLPGQFLNGRQTLGENISDVAGIRIAYDGLQRLLARERAAGRPVGKTGGLTPEQRFFVANAVIWRTAYRPEALTTQIRTGQHSPGPFRVQGPLSNLSAFGQAFACTPGDPMMAKEPIVVW